MHPPADEVPQDTLNVEDVDPHDDYAAAAAAPTRGSAEEKVALKITLTVMHGVGGALAKRVLTGAGFTQVDPVAQQAKPDPDFPTVPFPNPEEPGAFDFAMEKVQRSASDLIVAVDPDADRCVLVIPDPNAEKGWRQLSGDGIGSFFGEYIAQSAPAGSVSANSIVSSRPPERTASEHGLGYQHTLTGFKWIACIPGIRFGYEKTISSCPDLDQARDKDGISASVVTSSLLASLKARGLSGQEELDRAARVYSRYLTVLLTSRVDNLGLITEGIDRLRSSPPKELAGSPVIETTDLPRGWDELPGTNAITAPTEANDRVIAHPPGTGSKLKCYLEVILPVEGGVKVPRKAARERLTLIKAEFARAIGI